MRTSTTPRVAAALAVTVALVLGGCSEDDARDAVDRAREQASRAVESVDLPDVDWEKHGQELKDRIDRLADQADCSELRRLAKQERNDSEVTRYVKAKVREAC